MPLAREELEAWVHKQADNAPMTEYAKALAKLDDAIMRFVSSTSKRPNQYDEWSIHDLTSHWAVDETRGQVSHVLEALAELITIRRQQK